MKKILALFLFVVSFLTIQAQTPYDTVNVRDPQNFTEMTNVDTAYFQLIGRKANLNRRMSLTTLKNWILTGVNAVDSLYLSGDTLYLLQGLTLWSVPLAPASDGNGLFSAANNNDTIRVSTALLRAAFQITGGAYGMTVTSARTGSNATMTVTNSSSGRGISATSSTGTAIVGSGAYGVYGIGSTYGLWGYSSSGGYAVYGNSIGSLGGYFSSQYTSANDVQPSLRLDRITSGTAAAGIGNSIDFYNSTTTNLRLSARLASVWSTATDGSQSSRFEIYGTNNAVSARKLAIAATGQLTLDGYAANALNNVDSSLYVLAVDATGDVHTRAASGLGGDGNGIVDDLPAGDVTIKGNLSNNFLNLDSLQYLQVRSFDNVDEAGSLFFDYDGLQLSTALTGGGTTTLNIYQDNTYFYNSNAGEITGIEIYQNARTGIYMDGSSFSKVGAYALEGRFKVSNGAGAGTNDYLNIHAPDTIANGYIELFEKYRLANATPSTTNADTSFMVWIGNGAAATPSFIEMASVGGGADTDDQTLSTSNDTLTISEGNSVKLPITELLRDSVTTTTMTIDLETRYQKVVQIDMATATNLTLTINNPTNAGVYTFHFIGTSGTDNVTWPAAFLDAAGTALGTDALTTGTMYTCYYSSTDAKYYCK